MGWLATGWLGAVCLLVSGSAFPAVSLAQDGGLDHDRALRARERGDLPALRQVLRAARERVDGDLVDARLNRQGDRYEYELKFLSRNGELRTFNIDAERARREFGIEPGAVRRELAETGSEGSARREALRARLKERLAAEPGDGEDRRAALRERLDRLRDAPQEGALPRERLQELRERRLNNAGRRDNQRPMRKLFGNRRGGAQ